MFAPPVFVSFNSSSCIHCSVRRHSWSRRSRSRDRVAGGPFLEVSTIVLGIVLERTSIPSRDLPGDITSIPATSDGVVSQEIAGAEPKLGRAVGIRYRHHVVEYVHRAIFCPRCPFHCAFQEYLSIESGPEAAVEYVVVDVILVTPPPEPLYAWIPSWWQASLGQSQFAQSCMWLP